MKTESLQSFLTLVDTYLAASSGNDRAYSLLRPIFERLQADTDLWDFCARITERLGKHSVTFAEPARIGHYLIEEPLLPERCAYFAPEYRDRWWLWAEQWHYVFSWLATEPNRQSILDTCSDIILKQSATIHESEMPITEARTWTRAEAAYRIGVTPRAIRDMVKRKELETRGGAIVATEEQLQALHDRRRRMGAEDRQPSGDGTIEGIRSPGDKDPSKMKYRVLMRTPKRGGS